MSTAIVRRRADGIVQILPAPHPAVDPSAASIFALLASCGLYVAALIGAPLWFALTAPAVGVEVWRARRARRAA